MELDLRDLVGYVWKQKWFIIIFNLLAAMGSVGFHLACLKMSPYKSPLPNVYTAEALILIQEPSAESGLSGSSFDLPKTMSDDPGSFSYGSLAIKLFKNKNIVDVVAEEYNIAERYDFQESKKTKARVKIWSSIDTYFDKKSNTVHLSYTDVDPLYAANVLNRMVLLLRETFSDIHSKKNQIEKKMLEEKLSNNITEMVELENELKMMQKKYGIIDIDQLESEQLSLLANLKSQYLQKEIEIRTFIQLYNSRDLQIVKLRSEQSNIKKLMSDVVEGKMGANSVLLPQMQLPELKLKYKRIKRDLDVKMRIYQILTQKYELTKLENREASQEAMVQIIEEAETPEEKSGPSRTVYLAITAFLSFSLSILTVFGFHFLRVLFSDPAKDKVGVKSTDL